MLTLSALPHMMLTLSGEVGTEKVNCQDNNLDRFSAENDYGTVQIFELL